MKREKGKGEGVKGQRNWMGIATPLFIKRWKGEEIG
jgi:hypothetical protein